MTTSETSKCRAIFAPYCHGDGLDLGSGGDPITPSAISVELRRPYSACGTAPVHLHGDARQLRWFRDGVFDYVYSSHLLEDFHDTRAALEEWIRVLRIGGRLILYCPNEKCYRAFCHKYRGGLHNRMHKHMEFSLTMVTQILQEIRHTELVFQQEAMNDYSWGLVAVRVV